MTPGIEVKNHVVLKQFQKPSVSVQNKKLCMFA